MSRFKVVMKELMEQPEKSLLPWPTTAVGASKGIRGVEFFSEGGVPLQPPEYAKSLIMLPTDKEEDFDPFLWQDPTEVEREILFEYEGWRIENYPNTPTHECDWITHACAVTKWRQHIDQWMIMADGVCDQCCEEIPDEVMAIWKLKNMDHMPSEEVAKAVQGSMLATR